MRTIILALAVLMGVLGIANGIFMLVSPEDWYVAVPGVTDTGPFNQHFVRDIGLIFLLLGGCVPAWRGATGHAGYPVDRRHRLVVRSRAVPFLGGRGGDLLARRPAARLPSRHVAGAYRDRPERLGLSSATRHCLVLNRSHVETPITGGRIMKIVVIGGSGLVGSKLVTILRGEGHEVIAASPSTGVNTLTGEGLAEAFRGADVVVDVANSPSFEDAAVLHFFETSGRNILAAEAAAGVKHHIALSVVGSERLPDSGYFRAKIAQEKLIKASPVPYTIVRATQFYEFVGAIAQSNNEADGIHMPTAKLQPIAAERRLCRTGRCGGRHPCQRNDRDRRARADRARHAGAAAARGTRRRTSRHHRWRRALLRRPAERSNPDARSGCSPRDDAFCRLARPVGNADVARRTFEPAFRGAAWASGCAQDEV